MTKFSLQEFDYLEEIKKRHGQRVFVYGEPELGSPLGDADYLLRRLEVAEALIRAERPWQGSDKVRVFEAAWQKVKESKL